MAKAGAIMMVKCRRLLSHFIGYPSFTSSRANEVVMLECAGVPGRTFSRALRRIVEASGQPIDCCTIFSAALGLVTPSIRPYRLWYIACAVRVDTTRSG